MMKNLFDYATKELSQDAFLRWLFENYNCENESVNNACRKLFDSFTENKFKEKTITDLTTVAQWKNIDISIWFKSDGKEYLTALAAKICLEQQHAYYTSPAFNGSSEARDQVGTLMQDALVSTDADIDATLKKLFEKAVAECEYAAD